MSWLARSIANSLKLDEDDDEDDHTNAAVNPKPEFDPDPNQASPSFSHSSSDPNTPRGVKEDLSELTKTLSRQFWGVASFLAPPPPDSPEQQADHPAEEAKPLGSPSDDPDELSDEALIVGIRSDLSEIGGKFKTGISQLSNNINVSEFTKIASNFLQFGSEEEGLEKYTSLNAVGVTDEVIAFARDIAMNPETWLDFPIPDDGDFDDFDMSDEQEEHALAVEHLAPRLTALRIELCPGFMSEGCFWKIYFVLLHPRLNKYDAELLSTPQIVKARAVLMQGIQHAAKAKTAEDHHESGTANIAADLPHEESLSVPSPAQSKPMLFKESETEIATASVAVEISTEKHPVLSTEVQVVDKSVIEEGPIKEAKHQHSTSGSSVVSIEKYEDDADDWLKEETSEAFGTSATTVPLDNDEDVSFSDLEDDDVPISYKKMTFGSDSSTKDSRDWVQLGRSSMNSVKDVKCVSKEHSGSEQVNSRNPEIKESNDWLDIEEIM
ncbi:hypothetical protein F3Y22_tig00110387pilonHSYRG00596 [Hibiscus syriacus]|uniref:BSD domain-containing protein n=1 Tax=Hibiscus syriacus TaxID=106335 RepID=A0A6A3ATA6_HIBSY|nr:uncharacterized protein LOC120122454 [Hibiscus syriacus]KAE8707013.1 hypothetical protein F3Y22_tig00110387pilonHSYRG00596 [Hibiscus syriacus]